MDATNPYSSPAESSAAKPNATALKPKVTVPTPRTAVEAAWRGAKVGFKWVNWIAGPLATIMLIMALGVASAGHKGLLGLGRRQLTATEMTIFVGGPFYFYFSSCVWGIVVGAVLALVRFALSRSHDPSDLANRKTTIVSGHLSSCSSRLILHAARNETWEPR